MKVKGMGSGGVERGLGKDSTYPVALGTAVWYSAVRRKVDFTLITMHWFLCIFAVGFPPRAPAPPLEYPECPSLAAVSIYVPYGPQTSALQCYR